ncbi:MAG: hypothetical protein M1834_007543 [Cirrosporium novae-zelandiae]|nr:MAG: hypothetical protein M1834_007543 [Cirrosporium novae-zelandiae]
MPPTLRAPPAASLLLRTLSTPSSRPRIQAIISLTRTQSTFSTSILPSRRRPHRPSRSSNFSTSKQRCEEQPQKEAAKYSFEDIQRFSEQPQPDRIIVDVREPPELLSPPPRGTSGTIPTSINLPLQSSPDAIFMPPEEFYDKFGYEKPEKETELVFFCKKGVRARAAGELARRAGYQKVGVYAGSIDEWVSKGGKVVKFEG